MTKIISRPHELNPWLVADFEFCRRHAILGADDYDVRQDMINIIKGI